MFKIEAKGFREQLNSLTELEKEQLPFAMALALTRTAWDARDAIRAEMQVAFDRPTPYTLNAQEVFGAKKDRLFAQVEIKYTAGKGIAPSYWLAPEVQGGARRDKRSEEALRRRGLLPQGQYVVPGAGARLDRYGNMQRGQVTKMLSGLMAAEMTSGYSANASSSARSKKKGNARRFFVIRRGSERIGIGERLKWGAGSRNSWHVLLAFVRKPEYSKMLKFYEIAEKTAADRLPIRFREAMDRAIRTRR